MDIRLNLSSRPYLNRRAVRSWFLCLSGFLLLLLAFNLYYASQNYSQLTLLEQRLRELNSELAEEHGIRTDFSQESYDRTMQEVAAANRMIEADQFRWTRLLSRFEALLPGTVSIRSIQPNQADGTLRVAAVARDVSAMTAFIDALLASEDFSHVYLHSHNEQRPQQGPALVNFSLTIKEAF